MLPVLLPMVVLTAPLVAAPPVAPPAPSISDPVVLAALFGAGFVAGVLNVIAGGGSFLTLPALIFAGLPPTLANGTNRIAIVLQNVTAVGGFQRHRVMDWRWAALATVPATAGAALGTWAALEVGDEAFRKSLAVLMVVVSLWTLIDPFGSRRGGRGAAEMPTGGRLGVLVVAFFAVGVYGGFVQAGVGFLVLAATTYAGLDLVRGNAVKVLSILAFTLLSLAIFVAQGMVLWLPGLVVAAGTVLGALLGVRLTVLKGHRWIQGVVTASIVVFAVLLWFE
ncbi:MAG TPA: TSUP family transporter [Thermoanaerobaculia bacterium]|nr:TSUP family transporter [Thermoanaerobaculia bacterium]